MKYRRLYKNKILILSLLGITSLMVWGIYLFHSNNAIFLYRPRYIVLGLIAAKTFGLAASVYLVLHEMKINMPLADKFCHFSSITDCNIVLSSKASKIFGGITWADAGIIYFTGTLLYLAGAGSLWILAFISVLALPYPFFSIYFQAYKIKTLCPFCLIVQAVLIAEFILLLPVLWKVSIAVSDVLFLFVTISIPAAIWFILKAYRDISLRLKKVNDSYLKFRHNPEIFRFLLKNDKHEIITATNHLVLGKPDSPLEITAFLNLYCKPCSTAFNYLIKFVENNPEINLRLIFSFFDDKSSNKFINFIYYNYYHQGQEHTIEFLKKWYKSTIPERSSLINVSLPENFDISKSINRESKYLFDENKVTITPTIYLNGHKFPELYALSDIEYHMSELKNLSEEIRV